MKYILALLLFTVLISCDIVDITTNSSGSYTMSADAVTDLSVVFGSDFVSSMKGKITIKDLSAEVDADGDVGVSALCYPSSGKVEIDSSVPASQHKYLLAHEFTHIWQYKYAPSRSLYSFTNNTTSRQGEEAEATMVQVYMNLMDKESYTINMKRYAQSDMDWMAEYMRKFLKLKV